MQICIYLDIVFVVNLIVDFVVLWLLGIVMKCQINWFRLTLGANFGAISLLVFFFVPKLILGWPGIVLFIGISMGAVWIAYGKHRLILKWFLSTTIMIFISGIMNYLKRVAGITVLTMSSIMWLLIVAGVVCFIAIRIWGYKRNENHNLFLIQIKNNRHQVVEYVFRDTGNMLWDALSAQPVVLISEHMAMECLTMGEKEIVKEYQRTNQLNYSRLLQNDIHKTLCFHEIAFQSVGKDSGKLLCFFVDEIKIHGTDQILTRQAVAVGPSYLFEGKAYQGLLHNECI